MKQFKLYRWLPKLLSCAFLLVMLALGLSAGAQSANLLTNPGFEQDGLRGISVAGNRRLRMFNLNTIRLLMQPMVSEFHVLGMVQKLSSIWPFLRLWMVAFISV